MRGKRDEVASGQHGVVERGEQNSERQLRGGHSEHIASQLAPTHGAQLDSQHFERDAKEHQ